MIFCFIRFFYALFLSEPSNNSQDFQSFTSFFQKIRPIFILAVAFPKPPLRKEPRFTRHITTLPHAGRAAASASTACQSLPHLLILIFPPILFRHFQKFSKLLFPLLLHLPPIINYLLCLIQFSIKCSSIRYYDGFLLFFTMKYTTSL